MLLLNVLPPITIKSPACPINLNKNQDLASMDSSRRDHHKSEKGITWNCRGIKNASTTRELKRPCKENQPDFVFISETKSNENEMGKLSRRLNFAKMEVVQANGTAGVLALLWQETIKS